MTSEEKKMQMRVKSLIIPLLIIAVLCFATLAVVVSIRLNQRSKNVQAVQMIQTDEYGFDRNALPFFTEFCREHDAEFMYITSGYDVRCENQTTAVFYTMNMSENRRFSICNGSLCI